MFYMSCQVLSCQFTCSSKSQFPVVNVLISGRVLYLQNAMESLDKDDDGKVSFEEFYNSYEQKCQ